MLMSLIFNSNTSHSYYIFSKDQKKKLISKDFSFITIHETLNLHCSYYFDRTEFQNELIMMHSSDEDIELCSVDRFGSIEPNRTFYKKTQIFNQKIRKSSGTVRRDKIELVRLSSVRKII